MGVFCYSLTFCSTAGLDWPKQKQLLRKRALIATHLVGYIMILILIVKQSIKRLENLIKIEI